VTKDTIRRLDFWIGRAVCLVLTAHRRLLGGGKLDRQPPQRVLFLKLIEQGATVLAVPAIAAAIDRVGRENVYFLVFAENRDILDLLGLVPPGNVLALRHGSPAQFVADLANALRRIRRERIDTTIDMESFARASAVIAYLTGATRRVGLHRFTSEGPYRGDLMTHRIAYNPHLHAIDHYRVLVEALYTDPLDVPMGKMRLPAASNVPVARFDPTASERQAVATLIASGLGHAPSYPLVLLNPNAGDLLPLRRWPIDSFVELGRQLLEADERVRIVVTGTGSERSAADYVAGALGSRACSLAGRTTLRELLTLYSMADVLVTNDSGPGHFATLTGIDAVVLFGPETPRIFGGRDERTHIVWAELACSPCVNAFNHRFSPCTNNVCMQAITTDAVFAEVQRCLSAREVSPERRYPSRTDAKAGALDAEL
jgi:ADP-heptose:LPS heptosyltransferase